MVLSLFFFNCQIKKNTNYNYAGYSGIRQIESDLKKALKDKKTAIYNYPNLGTSFFLKKGKINGVFEIIINNDTIYYCNFKNNKPCGYYVFKTIHPKNINYYNRILPLKPNIDFGFGSGFFNSQHEKDGFWRENNQPCEQEGIYIKGKKEGIWKENCFNDIGGYTIYKNVTYKNDTIVSSTEK
ncbi:hypothetical protein GCM10022423_47470 [Flavobacterium ginsengiterrae]|uniref:MORN repeat protein n=2 Tax=Flavobacterium ginsengiterrae TaxID=871695 RepID=A0ABP7H6U6_9FLAO